MSHPVTAAELSLAKIRQLFRDRRGAAAKLATDIGVHKVTISQALHGRITSKRIVDAVRARAEEFLSAVNRNEAA